MLIQLALALLQEKAPTVPVPREAPAAAAPARQEPEKPPAYPPPAPLVLRGATVHTMVPGEAPRVVDLWLEDGRIRALGADAPSGSDPAAPDPSVRVIELAGKHVVPGLIDAHVNFDREHDALYLAAGVTLVRDVGGDLFALARERTRERRELGPGPTLLTAGAALDGDPPAAASAVVLRNADAAESYLPILFEERVDFLSFLPGLPDDAWRKALALAGAEELAVFGPRPARATLADAIAAGQGGFHSLDSLLAPGVLWDQASDEALAASVAALVEAKLPLVPLAFASASRLEDQNARPEWRGGLLGLLGPTYEAWWRAELAARAPFLAPERRAPGERALARQAKALREAFEAGVRLLPGSGSPQPWLMPGTALHQELAHWQRAGIPSERVLELATRGAAEALGIAHERGTIAPGLWAELIVLDEDPRADVARLFQPAWVVVRGRPFARAELDAAVAQLGERQAKLREELSRPVEVAPPPQGEEGVVILEGTVESDSFGQRVATERYRVVRLGPETLLFSSRVVHPPSASGAARELTLEQFVVRGRLEQVHAELHEGDSVLTHDGVWTANTWRMRSQLDGQIVNTPAPLREQPVCVDAGGVASLLILGQTPLAERVPIVQLHPGFDAEPVNWRLEVDGDGNHRVRTQVGYKAFKLDATGALEWALSKVGTGVVESRALSASAFGGAGLVAPADRAAAAEAAAREPASTEPKGGG